jgi:hypothetical protein
MTCITIYANLTWGRMQARKPWRQVLRKALLRRLETCLAQVCIYMYVCIYIYIYIYILRRRHLGSDWDKVGCIVNRTQMRFGFVVEWHDIKKVHVRWLCFLLSAASSILDGSQEAFPRHVCLSACLSLCPYRHLRTYVHIFKRTWWKGSRCLNCKEKHTTCEYIHIQITHVHIPIMHTRIRTRRWWNGSAGQCPSALTTATPPYSGTNVSHICMIFSLKFV